MLDTSFTQAASLYIHAPQADLRFAAVAAPTDGQAHGLETLWQLCAHLQRLGYPVAVLDGATRESDASPGLMHLIAQSSWNDGISPAMNRQAHSLAVLPAALGLRHLAHHSAPLAPLQDFFRAYALVVIYAGVETLAPLVAGQGATPLLLAAPGAAGVVHTYQQLKHMALHAGRMCHIASVVRGDTQPAQSMLAVLQRCAERHLGRQPHAVAIDANRPQDLQRLALQLLENAGTIAAPAALPMAPAMASAPAHFARSH